MKVIITEDKRNRLAINWLEDVFPNLKKYRFPGYDDEVFVMDNDMVKISYNTTIKKLFIKDDIWDPLRSWFGYTEDEIGELLLNWANKKFGFRAKKSHRVENI
jgi:hypothetical protein